MISLCYRVIRLPCEWHITFSSVFRRWIHQKEVLISKDRRSRLGLNTKRSCFVVVGGWLSSR